MVPSALRIVLTTGPGPEAGGSKNSISRPHWPEKSGIGAVPGLNCCANAADANWVTVATMMIDRMMGFSHRQIDSVDTQDNRKSLLKVREPRGGIRK
jgi:hypothetical protein